MDTVDGKSITWKRPETELDPLYKLMDGQVWRLTPGVDFTVPVGNLRARLQYLSSKLGVRVRTRTINGLLYVQAYQDWVEPVIRAADAPQAP